MKARLEDGPDMSKPDGNRDAFQVSSHPSFHISHDMRKHDLIVIQVLSSSVPSLIAALVYRTYSSDNVR